MIGCLNECFRVFKGTFVAKIEAVDQANSGLRIGYSIFSGNEREVFAINGNTGNIF